MQANAGHVVINKENRDVKTLGINDNFEYKDQRVAASVMLYPQPFGIQAEYNVSTGPEFNPETSTIEQKDLQGGYFQMMYLLKIKSHILIPFVRTQFYEGGKKHEIDARSYVVREHEFGIEWQPFKNFEFVAMYTISDRTFEDYKLPNKRQKGNLLRLKVQFNY